jgi:GNAT superfamily N-acetyltransferase
VSAAPTVSAGPDASAGPTASTGPDAGTGLLSVRRATEGDRQALTRMLARCSGDTRYRRFHGPVKAFPEPYLTEALAGSPVHVALIASAPPEPAAGAGTDADAVVALASCRLVAEGAAELGLLVEDGWQQRGVGGLLLRELVDFAARIGLRVLQAQLLAEQAWILGLLRRYGQCKTVATGGLLTVTVRLPRPGE